MDLQKSQELRKNKAAFIVSLVVMVYILCSGLYATVTSGPMTERTIRLSLCGLMILLNIGGYMKFRTSKNYMRICLNSFTVVYISTLIFSSTSFVYAYVYPMIICTLIYMNKIYVIGAGIVSIVANVGFFIKVLAANNFAGDMLSRGLEQLMLVILVSFGAFMAMKLTTQFNRENQQVIIDKAEEQKQQAEQIIELANQLGAKFDQAQELSGNLTSSMDSNHFAVSNIADSTLSTAQAIEQQTSMTYDIQQAIETAEEATKSMQDASEQTKTIIDESMQMMTELKSQAETVKQVSDTTRDVTRQLNTRVKDVDEIISTIINISGQTNLLALNASIEAARAGEAGRGFAVVADQIRTLSEETKNASNEITEIISQLTDYAGQATESMEQSVESSERQNELIDQTDKKFEDIRAQILHLYQNASEMTGMVDHIVKANTNITDSISQLSATSEEVSATSNECLTLSDTAMDALKQVNGLLEEIYAIAEQLKACADQE